MKTNRKDVRFPVHNFGDDANPNTVIHPCRLHLFYIFFPCILNVLDGRMCDTQPDTNQTRIFHTVEYRSAKHKRKFETEKKNNEKNVRTDFNEKHQYCMTEPYIIICRAHVVPRTSCMAFRYSLELLCIISGRKGEKKIWK